MIGNLLGTKFTIIDIPMSFQVVFFFKLFLKIEIRKNANRISPISNYRSDLFPEA